MKGRKTVSGLTKLLMGASAAVGFNGCGEIRNLPPGSERSIVTVYEKDAQNWKDFFGNEIALDFGYGTNPGELTVDVPNDPEGNVPPFEWRVHCDEDVITGELFRDTCEVQLKDRKNAEYGGEWKFIFGSGIWAEPRETIVSYHQDAYSPETLTDEVEEIDDRLDELEEEVFNKNANDNVSPNDNVDVNDNIYNDNVVPNTNGNDNLGNTNDNYGNFNDNVPVNDNHGNFNDNVPTNDNYFNLNDNFYNDNDNLPPMNDNVSSLEDLLGATYATWNDQEGPLPTLPMYENSALLHMPRELFDMYLAPNEDAIVSFSETITEPWKIEYRSTTDLVNLTESEALYETFVVVDSSVCETETEEVPGYFLEGQYKIDLGQPGSTPYSAYGIGSCEE